MNVGILTLVVLKVSLVLRIVVLILRLLDDVQRLHDLLSLAIVLHFDLLNQLLRVRSWRKGSLSVRSLALGRIVTIRGLFGSSQRRLKVFARGSSVS